MKLNFRIKSMICLTAAVVAMGIFIDHYDSIKKDLTSKTTISSSITFEDLTTAEATERLKKENGIIVLDVRTEEEYKKGHIENAIVIPVDTLKEKAPKTLKDKNATIFVYCKSGIRSLEASNILVELGYTNIYNLGGIEKEPYTLSTN